MVEDSGVTFPKPLFEDEESPDKVAERMGGYMCGATTTLMVCLGDTLGVFRYMSGKPPATSADIAAGTKLHERWVREMLYQLVTARLVSADKAVEQFWLSDAQAGVLANEYGAKSSPYCLCGFSQGIIEGIGKFKDIQNSIRTGRGLKYDDYGEDMACAVCRDIGVWTRHFLVKNVRTVTDLHERLESGAMCADIGCGSGLVLKELATAFPKSTFHGFDTSCKALERAQETLSGISNVSLKNPDKPGEQMAEKTYDFIITMDAIHDMAHPDQVLAIARKGLKDDAWGYLIADFKCKETVAENVADDLGLAMLGYGASVMLCLNSAMSEENSMGLGTMGWYPKLAQKMLGDAGFLGFEQLHWESSSNNFYWAKP